MAAIVSIVRMNKLRSSKVCLGTVILFLSVLPPGLAQTRAQATEATRQAAATPLDASLFQPELPPIQPILPDVQEIRLVLKLAERRVYVYNGEEMEVSYPVAVGKAGWETPTGQFEVMQMLRDPGWTNPFTGEVAPPGPDNPLGERWIAFWTDGKNFVGFHGTPNRESVGRAASHGCVRMFNEHIRELFERVDVGTPVMVVP